jgi:predicted HTH transcriptional regulator
MNIELSDLIDALYEEKTKEFNYENIEFKRAWDQEYGKKISAIGNRNFISEYFIVIGVEDDGSLSGHDEIWAKNTEEKISNHLNQYLSPSLACLSILTENVRNNYIIIIRCKNPGSIIKWNSKAYRASGTTLIVLEPHEELEISMKLPGLDDYSSMPHVATLDNELILESYYKMKENRDNYNSNEEEILKNSIVYLDYLKINNTNTSYILYGECRYRLVVYGYDGVVEVNEEIKGLYNLLKRGNFPSLIQLITKTYRYSNITLSEKAYREGLANAIMHAAYFENNGEIILEIYSDKIVISNLCYPESIAFANKWFSKSHRTYNRLMGEYLRLLKHVDELGLGKNVIFKECLIHGNPPPEIIIENAGRLKRWKLKIYYLNKNSTHKEIYKRLKAQYYEENKAIMALSLVLWRNKKVQDIRKYIDDEYVNVFVQIIDDLNGPVYYYEKNDSLILNRWVEIILFHGQDSKAFTPSEKLALYSFTYKMCSRFDQYLLTPIKLRELAHMGNSRSEQTQSSKLLAEWESEKKITRKSKGIYELVYNDKIENQSEAIKAALIIKS